MKIDSFSTLKDQKDNFESNTKCRLIYQAKIEMGKVSKIIWKQSSPMQTKYSNTISGRILLL